MYEHPLHSPWLRLCTDPQDYHQVQRHTYSRLRRCPNTNIKNNKSNSSSPHSTKSNLSNDRYQSQIDERDHHSQTDHLHKHTRNIAFQLSPSIINHRNSQHKPFKRLSYT
jgi:hypothetical protein